MIQQKILLTTTVFLIALVIYGLWAEYEADRVKAHDHHEFFDDMRQFKTETEQFMYKGDRNTNLMGYDLCRESEATALAAGRPFGIDCDQVYLNQEQR